MVGASWWCRRIRHLPRHIKTYQDLPDPELSTEVEFDTNTNTTNICCFSSRCLMFYFTTQTTILMFTYWITTDYKLLQ